MEPTKDQKSRTFTKEQKRYLYREISNESKKEYHRVIDSFKSYITNLINTKLLTEDEIFMKSRPYIRNTHSIKLNASDLGMPNYIKYPGHDEISRHLDISFYSDEVLPSYQNPKIKYESTVDFSIGPRIMEKCSPEEINFICDALKDIALKDLESEYFGLDSGWIRYSGYYQYFPGISTWGALYKKSPEYFSIIVDHYYVEPDVTKKKEEPNEYDLLRSLIRVLS